MLELVKKEDTDSFDGVVVVKTFPNPLKLLPKLVLMPLIPEVGVKQGDFSKKIVKTAENG